METILVRYNEIGLKSEPVRRRFEWNLRRNMIDMLTNDSVEAIVTLANARLYVETDDIDKAVKSLKKVFGIASLSVARVCGSALEEIESLVKEVSLEIIEQGDTFAIDARRDSKSYPYTSLDLEKILGGTVLDANADKDIRVKLTDPDKTMDITLVDKIFKVTDDEAFETCRELARKEGILAGTSSGAALAAVRKLSEEIDAGNIVVVLPDRGDRYLSKGLFD